MPIYLIDEQKKIIHNRDAAMVNGDDDSCRINEFKVEYEYAYFESRVINLIKNKGYNGCKRCLKKYNRA